MENKFKYFTNSLLSLLGCLLIISACCVFTISCDKKDEPANIITEGPGWNYPDNPDDGENDKENERPGTQWW